MARRSPPDPADRVRCAWGAIDPLYRAYHDREWGVPLHDDRRLFELLCLEGAQAGLAWITILRKRAGYRRAFDRFDPAKVAGYGAAKVALAPRRSWHRPEPAQDRGARSRTPAPSWRSGRSSGRFDRFVWGFVGGAPRQNAWRSLRDVPAADAGVRRAQPGPRDRGFTFVGSTICYAFMQAAGLVNDHVVDCFRHPEVARLRARGGAPEPHGGPPRTRRERP